MITELPQCALFVTNLKDSMPVGLCADACMKLVGAVVGTD